MAPMQPTWIKICGVRTPEIADAVVDAGADALGLVFAPGSPRQVTQDEARAILRATPGSVTPVGLFVNPDDAVDDVRALADRLRLRALQFHGRADKATEAFSGSRIFRVASFDAQGIEAALRAADRAAALEPSIAALIVDTPDPDGPGGGTGSSFDWRALRDALDRADPMIRIVLAGGLHPDNVADAVRIVRPWGVDVSSGVESSRGVKDPQRIAAFCRAARSAI